jgi:hypothetical protein
LKKPQSQPQTQTQTHTQTQKKKKKKKNKPHRLSPAALINQQLSRASPEGVLAVWAEQGRKFNKVNYTTALHIIAARTRDKRKPARDARMQELLQGLAHKLEQNTGYLDVQQMATVAHALAKLRGLKKHSARVLRPLAVALRETGPTMQTEALINTLWAYAKAGVQTEEISALYLAFSELLVLQEHPLPVEQLVSMSGAFATAKVDVPQVFTTVADQLTGQQQQQQPWTGQQLASLAQSFAQNAPEHKTVFAYLAEILATEQGRLVQALSAQEIANTLWGYEIAGHMDTLSMPLLTQLLTQATRRVSSMTPVELTQLRQVLLGLELRPLPLGEGGSSPHTEELSEMLTTLRGRLPRDPPGQQQRGSDDASEHARICSVLLQPMWSHALEVIVPDTGGLLSLDLAQEATQTAIEFDGPHKHYLYDLTGSTTHRDRGPTVWKHEMLRRLGWTVTRIHYWDYINPDTKPYEERRAYLVAYLGEKLAAANIDRDLYGLSD